jgi:2',3'-cyclic-nucleotide 2'-phosphodiesterase (5'-nucleotidase family)
MYQQKSRTIIILLIVLFSINCEDPIDLTNYKFPTKDMPDKFIRIAILGTNDLHGGIFPTQFPDSKNNKFPNGGAVNLFPYAKILSQQWTDQFLWLDGGDQIQGTMECMLSDCKIMTDYYNYAGLHGIGLGNHDFDYGLEYLEKFIQNQKFPVIVANVKDNKDGKYLNEKWKNVEAYKVYEFGTSTKIKVGVIGLASKTSPSQTSTDISNLVFEDYYTTTKKYEKILRENEKVNAVILLTHFGPKCENEEKEKMVLQMRDSTTQQRECKESEEIMSFLEQIKNDPSIQIDGVVAAHVHDIVHHWISGIPVIESSGSDYFNVLYLPFKVDSKDNTITLQTSKITIEGPVPVCEKLWPDTKNCVYRYEDSSLMKDFIFHGRTMFKDDGLNETLKYWDEIINAKIKNDLCETKDDMYLDDTKETLLTNFVNDIGRIITESDICFFNLGGIRSTWHKGNINEIDLFRMFPFNNTWVRFEMTGEEVYHMFQNLAGSAIYPYSGTIQNFDYINKIYTMKNLLVWDGEIEKPLEPQKTYKVCTNDFLANGGSGMGKVRKWYTTLRNKKDFGIIRELLLKYLKNMKPITKEKFVDENYPRININN